MMNVLIVILTALLINIWADDGSHVEGQWPDWVDARVVPLVCLAAVVAALLWRQRETRAGRTAFRLSVVTLLACLLNIVPFVLHDLDQPVSIKPGGEHAAVVTKVPTLLDNVLAIVEPSRYQAKSEKENTQSRYLSALARCIEEKAKHHSSYNAAKFECVSIASRLGTADFTAVYVDK